MLIIPSCSFMWNNIIKKMCVTRNASWQSSASPQTFLLHIQTKFVRNKFVLGWRMSWDTLSCQFRRYTKAPFELKQFGFREVVDFKLSQFVEFLFTFSERFSVLHKVRTTHKACSHLHVGRYRTRGSSDAGGHGGGSSLRIWLLTWSEGHPCFLFCFHIEQTPKTTRPEVNLLHFPAGSVVNQN